MRKYSISDYLINSQGVPSNQFLVQAQAGTEPFTGEPPRNLTWGTTNMFYHDVGSATLTINSYSLAIN